MVELSLKEMTVKPSTVSHSKEVIKLVDGRSHRTRAYIIPAKYEKYIIKALQRIEDEIWAEKKMQNFSKRSQQDENFDDMAAQAWQEMP